MENQTPTATNLSFTIVNGNAVVPNLKWSSFEVHATGCKDVVGIARKNTPEEFHKERTFDKNEDLPGGFWIELAPTPAAAVEQALGAADDSGDLRGMGYLPKDFRICPCCTLSRMRAAGRA
jgi:hypothetical protein